MKLNQKQLFFEAALEIIMIEKRYSKRAALIIICSLSILTARVNH